MAKYQAIFERMEQKYRLNEEQLRQLMPLLETRMQGDEYGNSTILSLYFDNAEDELIRHSLEKPVYKEKLRLRSYGVPNTASAQVFLEIKKKYDGIVYKRRISLTLQQARLFMVAGTLPKDGQIARELQYFRNFYRCFPKAMIAYDRIALYDKEDSSLRITIDRNIRGRDTDLDPTQGAEGYILLPPGDAIVEVKAQGGLPLWLCRMLCECGAVPTSYSKYGSFYMCRNREKFTAGGDSYVQQCS